MTYLLVIALLGGDGDLRVIAQEPDLATCNEAKADLLKISAVNEGLVACVRGTAVQQPGATR